LPFRSTRGRNQSPQSLPATPGAECVGRVATVGSGVTDLRPGDLVIHLQRENWVQRLRGAAADAIPLPANLDLMQAAMLRINPATALCLLEDHVGLRLGDWVIQNAANSAVGRHLTALAKVRVHTIAVVNRGDVAAELQALGANAVLQDGPDLAERAQAVASGAPIRLGIDAIGGEAGRRIGDCLVDGGVAVSYGASRGSDPMLSPTVLMRGVGMTRAQSHRGGQMVPPLGRAGFGGSPAAANVVISRRGIEIFFPKYSHIHRCKRMLLGNLMNCGHNRRHIRAK
jgi:NADPH:quinone reductase-like Zn-dependent oxidoreductase